MKAVAIHRGRFFTGPRLWKTSQSIYGETLASWIVITFLFTLSLGSFNARYHQVLNVVISTHTVAHCVARCVYWWETYVNMNI